LGLTQMISDPKPKTYRNQKYLKFIRRKPCCLSGWTGVEAHHVRRSYWGAGTGIKSHDYAAISLHPSFHDPKSEKQLQVEEIIISNLIQYIQETDNDNRPLIQTLMEYIESKRKGHTK